MKLATLIMLVACSGADAGGHDKHDKPAKADAPARDWSAHPAIVELDGVDDIYALSDPHGSPSALRALLEANHVVKGTEWTAGKAVLVVAGDLIDKGDDSLGVIDLLRGLEAKAKAKGGRVVVTIGNHEAEFLADPHNKKASSTGEDKAGIDSQLADKQLDPDELARGADAAGRGKWLRELPFGARIGKWFFAHGGNTNGDSIGALSKRLQQGVDKHGFADDDVTGKKSILEAQAWYGNQDKDDIGKHYCDALGVKHIAFGHDPGAFGEHGHVLASKDGSVVKLDVEMGLHESKAPGGLMLHVATKGKDSAEVLDAAGKGAPLL